MARLMRPGARGGWVNGQLSWGGLDSWSVREGEFRSDHLALARELHAIHRVREQRTGYYGYYGENRDRTLDLSDCDSPQLWSLLDEAARTGLPLIHAAPDARRAGAVRTRRAARRHQPRRQAGRAGERGAPPRRGGRGSRTRAAAVPRCGRARTGLRRAVGGRRGPRPRAPAAAARAARETRAAAAAADGAGRRATGDPGRGARPLRRRDLPGSAPCRRGGLVGRVVHAPRDLRAGADAAGALRRRARARRSTGRGPTGSARRPGMRRWRAARRSPASATATPSGRSSPQPSSREPASSGSTCSTRTAGRRRRRETRWEGSRRCARRPSCCRRCEERGIAVEIAGEPADYRDLTDSLTIGVSTAEIAGESDWFDLGVTIAVEGRELPLADVFVALARGESRLLLDDGATRLARGPPARVAAPADRGGAGTHRLPVGVATDQPLPGRAVGRARRARRRHRAGRGLAAPGRRPARARAGPGPRPARRAGGRAAPLPARGVRLAGFPVGDGARRHPRRRHGARQDAADAGAALPRARTRSRRSAPSWSSPRPASSPTGSARRPGSPPG